LQVDIPIHKEKKMATAYRRMIFVGLGGSGGKTLRFLKRDINRWFNRQEPLCNGQMTFPTSGSK